MNIKLNLTQSSQPLNPSFLYNKWTQYVKDNKTGYFMLSNSLEDYLPYISSAAINLYVFYAIHAKSNEGYSYYSNETISRILNVSQKTITNWNKTLQDLGLIARRAKSNSSSDTYLLPLSDFIIDLSKINNDDREVMDFLNQEGYSKRTFINLYVSSEPNKRYCYSIFERNYAVKDFKMTRKILLGKVQSINNSIEIDLNEQIMWCKINDNFCIIWNTKKKSNNNQKGRLDLVSQLDTANKIKIFKKNYPQVKM